MQRSQPQSKYLTRIDQPSITHNSDTICGNRTKKTKDDRAPFITAEPFRSKCKFGNA